MPKRMIDELARTLRLADIHDLPSKNVYEHGHPEFDDLDPQQQEYVRRKVRALLVRLQRPSRAMREKAVRLWGCSPESFAKEWAEVIGTIMEERNG